MPVKNRVEDIDLHPADAFLPLFECVVNAIISLKKDTSKPITDKKIQVQLIRGAAPNNLGLDGHNTIRSIKVIDNGDGFTDQNMQSYVTAHTHENRAHGCKGVGRFTVLAAYREIAVTSTYMKEGECRERTFVFNLHDEVRELDDKVVPHSETKTVVTMDDCYNQTVLDSTAVSVNEVAEKLMNHCLIYYLCDELPRLEVIDTADMSGAVVNELYTVMSKERERTFEVKGQTFDCYVMKAEKRGNRKNHYIYYCANSRVVGGGRSIGAVNGAFQYPIMDDSKEVYLDVYVVGELLNKKVHSARNGFSIPQSSNPTYNLEGEVTFDSIEEALVQVLGDVYQRHLDETKARTVETVKKFIREQAPRYRRYLNQPEILGRLPANLPEDKIEEHLNRIAFAERKKIEKNIQDVIDNKDISKAAIESIRADLGTKAAVDADTLADYMLRRKAIIELFKKFLNADAEGKYKLEEEIHNLIFPKGVTSDQVDYETHNLWLLDERFAQYHFIASDLPIQRISQVKSRKEADLVLVNNEEEETSIFGKPISFAQERAGIVSNMVIFEFKRPGEVAHQKNRTDYRWEYGELVEPYFDDFMFSPVKKNWLGNQVRITKDTPKHGFVIVDQIPAPLEEFNKTKGWKRTPFGTIYKLNGDYNLHIEVITFQQLIDAVEKRHAPFFTKLFDN